MIITCINNEYFNKKLCSISLLNEELNIGKIKDLFYYTCRQKNEKVNKESIYFNFGNITFE